MDENKQDMEHLWNIYGTCMEYTWNMYGTYGHGKSPM
jgi:hypothetical protein